MNPSYFYRLFSDASFDRRTGASGYGIIVRHPGFKIRDLKAFGSFDGITDNNEAEMKAAHQALLLLQNYPMSGQTIFLHTDSQYVRDHLDVSGMEWLQDVALLKVKWLKGSQGFKSPDHAMQSWCDSEAKSQMRVMRDRLCADRTNYQCKVSQ